MGALRRPCAASAAPATAECRPGRPPAAAGRRYPAWPGHWPSGLPPPARGKGFIGAAPRRLLGAEPGSHPVAPAMRTRPLVTLRAAPADISIHLSLSASSPSGTPGSQASGAGTMPSEQSLCWARPHPVWVCRVLSRQPQCLPGSCASSLWASSPVNQGHQKLLRTRPGSPSPPQHTSKCPASPPPATERAGGREVSVPVLSPPMGTHTLERSWGSKVLGKHVLDRRSAD